MKHLYTDVYDEQTWQQIEQKAELKAHLEKCALAPSLTRNPNLPFTLTLALALTLVLALARALTLPLPLTRYGEFYPDVPKDQIATLMEDPKINQHA